MAGPKLEIYRMAVYLMFPVVAFYYFNLPEYRAKHVEPHGLYPPKELVYQSGGPNGIPQTEVELRARLEQIREERRAMRLAREAAAAAAAPAEGEGSTEEAEEVDSASATPVTDHLLAKGALSG
ncbi:hypothetical protein H696_01490 [Fonticula alba]|uniref:Uncharacterized protein n=1 Tax=Fonticula alba TaxID=691883 RepID=A0A058ZF22_FONAL|nr:hypothetical protein H696_01490 [Fonticula alba]KCV72082.1 hypothetical protein H696_01490 [Fonticula alba]|eukprot:XP_009493660.1 hypothetical protein H696_01490 [Fonticula alba]